MAKSASFYARQAEQRALEKGGVFVPRTLLRGEDAEFWRELRNKHGGEAKGALETLLESFRRSLAK